MFGQQLLDVKVQYEMERHLRVVVVHITSWGNTQMSPDLQKIAKHFHLTRVEGSHEGLKSGFYHR